jgi:hypothetical protein
MGPWLLHGLTPPLAPAVTVSCRNTSVRCSIVPRARALDLRAQPGSMLISCRLSGLKRSARPEILRRHKPPLFWIPGVSAASDTHRYAPGGPVRGQPEQHPLVLGCARDRVRRRREGARCFHALLLRGKPRATLSPPGAFRPKTSQTSWPPPSSTASPR